MAKSSKEKSQKMRLDSLLVSRGFFDTVEEAQAHILAGEVWTGQSRLDKAGVTVTVDMPLEVRNLALKFVSRAGYKLEHALDSYKISVKGKTCLDVGASTGGFTDCLLQRGAAHVFAVDVGTGQLHPKMRGHAQVTVMERLNARDLRAENLTSADGKFSATDVSFVCADVSFVSLENIVPVVQSAIPAPAEWVLLFKPQFQVAPKHIGKGGIVLESSATQAALEEFLVFMQARGLFLQNSPLESPLAGKKSGNVEILLHFGKERVELEKWNLEK